MAELSEQFIDQIYEASFVPEKWPALLDGLAKAVDGMGGYLFTISRGASAYVASDAVAPHVEAFIHEGWMAVNGRAARAEALAYPGFITDLDAFSEEELEREPIYRDFLRPRGMGWAAGTHIPLPTGDVLSFNLERSTARGPFERPYVEALDRLRPHIARAAMVGARIGLEKARAGADALEALGLPAAVLGGRGQLLACNQLMDKLIPATVQDGADRAQITDKKADALLETALSALAGGARRGIVQSFPIKGADGKPSSVAHLLPVRGSAHDLFSRMNSILVVMPLPGPGAPPAKVLQALFDLTPSEARIASALADGRTIDAISQDFGIARETVRSHLRSIFAKSGVSKQSSLVRLLLGVTLPRPGS
ncbi:DNA-binding CsgD family transcriptional regulator [Aminobacter lissarensis]|uniref:DNA-binding CsgD family transcriptional regulator n=1 Tax=Aminobacter carboxidus TaxID=376165 RepID=A0A8E1WEL3_9HYPH|nr:helix-turn-helix transcriptional regulator [Aminobacter lissarensis]MBB6466189.1 DNA-binding CsgD family transcriptional regulator [Aminobacter lissarensis]